MSDWTPERVAEQYALFERPDGGIHVWLCGGPFDGTRGNAPHLDWVLWLVTDGWGEPLRLPYPPDYRPELEDGECVIGSYRFDRDHECFRWIDE